MEERHKHLLKELFGYLKDDLRDGTKYYKSAEKSKEHNDSEFSNFFISNAKQRIEHSDVVKEKINYICKQMKDDDKESPYKVLYDSLLDDINDLRNKTNKFMV